MMRHKKEPVGVYTIYKDSDYDATNAFIAIYVNQKYQGKGYGTKLAERGNKWLDNHKDEYKKVYWDAHVDNEASNALAKKMGFNYMKTEDNYNFYTKEGNRK